MQASTITISISLIIMVFLYLVFFRPWQLRWGATDAEVKRSMPGDEIVSKPSFNATRAVTILEAMNARVLSPAEVREKLNLTAP